MKASGRLKLRLLAAIGAGSGLVACAESNSARPGDRSNDLSPVPEPMAREGDAGSRDYPYCFGPDYDTGYSGQCCLDVYCGPRPAAGCPEAPDSYELTEFGYPSTGSGECACGDIEGPFAGETPDECCYVAGIVGCTGRPLRHADALVLAPVVRRTDWS